MDHSQERIQGFERLAAANTQFRERKSKLFNVFISTTKYIGKCPDHLEKPFGILISRNLDNDIERSEYRFLETEKLQKYKICEPSEFS